MYAYAFILISAQKLGELKKQLHQGLHHVIGTKISKEFYEGVFTGEISEVCNPEIGDTSLWYKVTYGDGDQENMDEQEILPLINNATTKPLSSHLRLHLPPPRLTT